MHEWKQMPRSIRLETPTHSLDVWPYKEPLRIVYKYTVFDKINRRYVDNGNCRSQDEACEMAMKVAGL